MRRLSLFALAIWMVLGACTPAESTLPPTTTSTATPTATATPFTASTQTPTPTPDFVPGVKEPTVDPHFIEGYAFEFNINYAGDATITGNARTCGDIKGPWHLEIAVNGSPEEGATLETTGAVDFKVPEDTYLVETRIPTTGTGTFDYGDGVAEGTIDDPLLFGFELSPDNKNAAITLTSTGAGTVVLHLSDANVPVKFATVFMTDPTFVVDLTEYDKCP